MDSFFRWFGLLCWGLVCVCSQALAGGEYASWVDTRIGCDGHGHVFVGANVPWGMVCAGPVMPYHGWDWCSGYHWSGDSIVGFAQTHLSGTGCSDLGDICVMPMYGLPVTDAGHGAFLESVA